MLLDKEEDDEEEEGEVTGLEEERYVTVYIW